MSFREFRHEMKQIALATIEACRHCQFLRTSDLPAEPADDDLFVFMDDDDWISSGLFDVLRAQNMPRDGFLWGSIYLGKFVVDLPGISAASPAVKKRPLDNTVYTNNYSVTGRALKRLGKEAIFEHGRAQQQRDAGDFQPKKIPPYLTCANKHPACTVSAQYNFKNLSEGLRPMVAGYAEALRDIQLDQDTLWIAPYLRRMEAVVSRCLA